MKVVEPTPGHEKCHHRIYALTCDEYEALLARAAARCELCRKPAVEEYNGKLVIDHEGRIGNRIAVRGLLCQKCNAHMRRVDRSERPMSRPTFAYLDLSGYFVPQGFPYWERWTGSFDGVRAEMLNALNVADAARGALRAKPRLACAPMAVRIPW